MEHLFFDSIDEMRNQTGSHGPNYLRNHTAERDYFSPLSIVTSIQKPQEYLFSNYMDAWSFCVHTPNKHEFFHETYMHKHNFFELMYVQRGQVRVMIEGAETTYTQGNLCLLNRNTMHRETDMSNADIVYIGIDASLLTQWPKSFPPPFQYKSILNQFFSDNLSERADYKKDYLDFTLLGEDTIPQLTQELIRAFTVKRIGYQFDVYSSLLRLFAALENPDIYKATHISLRNSQELLTAEQVKKLIETHHGAIQRTNLAEALNYSCEHISRIIKTNTGYTLKAPLDRIRIHRQLRCQTPHGWKLTVLLQNPPDHQIRQLLNNLLIERSSIFIINQNHAHILLSSILPCIKNHKCISSFNTVIVYKKGSRLSTDCPLTIFLTTFSVISE